jgi:hypothetical protein
MMILGIENQESVFEAGIALQVLLIIFHSKR